MLDDDEILQTWMAASDVHTAVENLIEAAKESGGHDNITVGIVHVSAAGEMQASRNVRVTREIKAAL